MKKFIVVLIIIAGAWYYQQFPQQSNSMLVSFHKMERPAKGLYLSQNMSDTQREQFMQDLEIAKIRVSEFFGDIQADPTIIAGSDEGTFQKYGSDSISAAITHFFPWKAYIVLGPDGLNADVIAHELSHAEIYTRLGYFRRNKLPVWFDEGLAMQNDYRPEYSESEYQRIFNNREPLKLTEIDTKEEFWSDTDEKTDEAYLTAKHEVAQWYARAGGKDIDRLLKALGGAGSFYTTYYLLEE